MSCDGLVGHSHTACLYPFVSIKLFQFLKQKMLNCYTPRAAPRNRGDGKGQSSRDGKGDRMDEDDLLINGSVTATDSPSKEPKRFLRSDGRAPYDMRQVSVSSW